MKVPLTRVSVIMTVKNDPAGCAETIGALLAQDRLPDEIVIADGGSEDATIGVLRRLESTFSLVKVVDAPGANIARGRNIAASVARGDVLAFTDAGCRPVPNWLAELVRPIEREHADFVAGAYRVVGGTLFEKVVGLATMRGQLEPVSPETFNPSARSMGCTRRLWAQVAGFPEWLAYSEDTLFDHKVRASGCHWKFAPQAIVEWRPRGTWVELGRQFYHYGTGRGHTQIGAADFAYNIRNLAVISALILATLVTPWAGLLLFAALAYFYIWTFHTKAKGVASAIGWWFAYPVCILVMWVVLFSNLAGYLVGSWQRRRDAEQYHGRMSEYLATANG